MIGLRDISFKDGMERMGLTTFEEITSRDLIAVYRSETVDRDRIQVNRYKNRSQK